MLKNWLKAIEKRSATAKANDEPFGACLLPDPNGGPPMCVQLDSTTCKNLNGKFLGGDCFPGIVDAGKLTPSKDKKKKPGKKTTRKRRAK